ncbi:MAG: hypothetical protein OEY96_12635 [Gammaproteobacteria bacterium]|nr:hypothetical protein [Gammaproteobacteria bacterium]
MIGLMVLTFYFIVYALLFLTIAHFVKNNIGRGLLFIFFALTPYYLYIYQRHLLEYHCLNTEYIKPVEKVSYPEVIFSYTDTARYHFVNTATKYLATSEHMRLTHKNDISMLKTSKDLIFYDIEKNKILDKPASDIQISYAIVYESWSQDGLSFYKTEILKVSDMSVVSNITEIYDPYARKHIWQYLDLINVGKCMAGSLPSERLPPLLKKLIKDTFI